MPVIVAFGNSNTWGYEPVGARRYPLGVRWTSILQAELGTDFRVVEEGLNGRTTVWDDPIEPHRCGIDYLIPCLMSHAPLDLVIIALGCNDLKKRFSLSPSDIASGVERLVVEACAMPVGPGGACPQVLLAAPPPVAKLTDFAEAFEGGEAKSRLLGERYAAVAERQKVAFLDAGKHIRCSDRDGIHFEADQHAILGRAMAGAVRAALAERE